LRVISFRHEQNAGYAASIAGFLTQKPGDLPHGVRAGLPQRLTALAHATTNCFPMILISGSSEREIVDLQQGDYEEMDQLAIAKPLAKAAFPRAARRGHRRRRRAGDPRRGVGRPGGVYLDLPRSSSRRRRGEAGRQSLIKVVDAAPRQIPAQDAVKRALDLLKSAKRR
jgi:oxalyl-CoA decarboxylase